MLNAVEFVPEIFEVMFVALASPVLVTVKVCEELSTPLFTILVKVAGFG